MPAENLIGQEGKGLKIALTTLNDGRLSIPNISRRHRQGRASGSCRALGGRARAVGQADRQARGDRAQDLGHRGATPSRWSRVASLATEMSDRGGYDIRLEAAAAKEWNTVRGWEIVDETMQIRGGRGYETEQSLAARGEEPIPVERMMRDYRINKIFEGSTEIMHLFMAREVVDKHLQVAGALIDPDKPLVGEARRAAEDGRVLRLVVPDALARLGPLAALRGLRARSPRTCASSSAPRASSRARASTACSSTRRSCRTSRRSCSGWSTSPTRPSRWRPRVSRAQALADKRRARGGARRVRMADVFCRLGAPPRAGALPRAVEQRRRGALPARPRRARGPPRVARGAASSALHAQAGRAAEGGASRSGPVTRSLAMAVRIRKLTLWRTRGRAPAGGARRPARPARRRRGRPADRDGLPPAGREGPGGDRGRARSTSRRTGGRRREGRPRPGRRPDAPRARRQPPGARQPHRAGARRQRREHRVPRRAGRRQPLLGGVRLRERGRPRQGRRPHPRRGRRAADRAAGRSRRRRVRLAPDAPPSRAGAVCQPALRRDEALPGRGPPL